MTKEGKEIGIMVLLGMLWRALFIQASWSFERMQTLGFVYAMMPALRKLYPDRDEFAARINQHMEYFNTQPYLASFILGAAARMEQERASGRNPNADALELKTALMAPLGALGDSFFWGSLKPLAAVSAAAALMSGAQWAPILFLIIFNLWHVPIRAGSLFMGFTTGGDVKELISRYKFTTTARLFKAISLSLLGAILGMSFMWRDEVRPSFGLPAYAAAAACLAITLAFVSILRRGGTPIKLMLGIAAASIALAYMGVV